MEIIKYIDYFKGMQTPFLKNKVVVLTGASSGIGMATAVVLAELGAKQVLTYFGNEDGAKKTLEMVKDKGGDAVLFKGDLALFEEAKKLAGLAIKSFGGVDILVNNSGTHDPHTFLDINEELWDRIMDINIKSAYNVSYHIIPLIVKRGGGKVINNSSIVAKSGGLNGGTNYTTSKGAVSAFTRSLANHLARYNITVNTISPGMTNTKLITWRTDEQMKQSIINIPMRRVGECSEIGYAIAFLASPYVDFITGYEMDINGGMYID